MSVLSPILATRVITRRDVLLATGVTATTLLAGCRSLPFSETEVQTGHLFVQNREDRPVEVALSVIERSDGGDSVLDAMYRVPADTALQFEAILHTETTYEITARQPELDRNAETSLEIVAETCQEGDPAGKVDVAVSVSSNGPEISVFNCETPYTRTGEFDYEAPSDHRIGTPTGTVGSPPPS